MKSKLRYIILILLLWSLNTTEAQRKLTQKEVDSIITHKRNKNFKVGFALDSRWTLYKRRNIKLSGLLLHFTLYKRHQFGIGLYFLNNQSVLDVSKEIAPEFEYEVRATMSYFANYYRYSYYRRNWVDLGGAIYFGLGNVSTYYFNEELQRNENLSTRPIYVLEFNHPVRFHLTHWLEIHTGLGFRVVLDQDRHIAKAFNNLVYQFGVTVKPVEVYRCLFRRQPWIGFKQRSDADYKSK